MKKDPDARPSADEVRLGLLEAGRGVHATEIYPEPLATEPTRQSPRSHRGTATGHRAKSARWRKVGTSGQGGGSWSPWRSWPCSPSSAPSPSRGSSAEERSGWRREPAEQGGTESVRRRAERAGRRRGQQAAPQPAVGRAGGRRSGTGERRFQRGASRREDGAGVLHCRPQGITTGQPSFSASWRQSTFRTGPPSKARSTKWRA